MSRRNRNAIPYGLERPEKEPQTIAEMRKEIVRESYEGNVALIRQAFNVADIKGMRGEDRYVFLAYHALRQLQDMSDRMLEFVNCSPAPFNIPDIMKQE